MKRCKGCDDEFCADCGTSPRFGYDAAVAQVVDAIEDAARRLRAAATEVLETCAEAVARVTVPWPRKVIVGADELPDWDALPASMLTVPPAPQEQLTITVAAFTDASVEAAKWVSGDPDMAAAFILKAAGIEVQRG